MLIVTMMFLKSEHKKPNNVYLVWAMKQDFQKLLPWLLFDSELDSVAIKNTKYFYIYTTSITKRNIYTLNKYTLIYTHYLFFILIMNNFMIE